MHTPITRNVAILHDILSGKSPIECAEQWRISVASITNNLRAIVNHLKEHTGLQGIESLNVEALRAQKRLINQHLKMPFPKVNITSRAKLYLKETVGLDYVTCPVF